MAREEGGGWGERIWECSHSWRRIVCGESRIELWRIWEIALGGDLTGQSHLIALVGVSLGGSPSPSPPASASPPRRFSATSPLSPSSAPIVGASTCSPAACPTLITLQSSPNDTSSVQCRPFSHSPMLPDCAQNPIRPSRQTRYEVPPVNRRLAVRPPRGFYHRSAVHVRPLAAPVRFHHARRRLWNLYRIPASRRLELRKPGRFARLDAREESAAGRGQVAAITPRPTCALIEAQVGGVRANAGEFAQLVVQRKRNRVLAPAPRFFTTPASFPVKQATASVFGCIR